MQATRASKFQIIWRQFKRRIAMAKLAAVSEAWEPNLTNQMRIAAWRAAK